MTDKTKQFKILDKVFPIDEFPKLYQWSKSNPDTLENQLQSIANAWHEGSIVSAAQALESDLKH